MNADREGGRDPTQMKEIYPLSKVGASEKWSLGYKRQC